MIRAPVSTNQCYWHASGMYTCGGGAGDRKTKEKGHRTYDVEHFTESPGDKEERIAAAVAKDVAATAVAMQQQAPIDPKGEPVMFRRTANRIQ
jgi:hypothetical protein